MTTTIPVDLGERSYLVLVGAGCLADITGLLPDGARRALLVTQPPVVAAGHADHVQQAMEAAGVDVVRVEVPDGEGAKSVSVLADLWSQCAQAALTRQDLVVAVGGGVVGDLAGFAAASYNRGIAVLQVPTTLLAQVDAAIGGKTGINLAEGKNLVGAFHQPCGVLCDAATLATLPERLLREGLGEVVKYGLIRDEHILDLLEAQTGTVTDDPDLLEALVKHSVLVKAAVVAEDEREAGLRAHLNFGHTYGHAVENLTGYDRFMHGEAVAIGMVVALRLGVALGRTPPAVAERAEALLRQLKLPTRPPKLDRDQAWTVMGRDKKAGTDEVRFVVLDDLAQPTLVTPDRATVNAVLDALEADDEADR